MEVTQRDIREIVFTGTTSDPQLYRYEARLIETVRREVPGARLSIHTNGALALKKIETFNMYDRACISLPTFNVDTYARMMGSRQVPNLEKIAAASKIPLKVSCVVNEHNAHEVDAFLLALSALGIRRVVLRQLFGDRRRWKILAECSPLRHYRGNPVFGVYGMEVTWWNFDTATSRSINLFADGTIGFEYLLTETVSLSRS
ncbi:MAG: hypothetical protein LDLANPLL_00923 [Turneriella sp.]|nr:hypothetical protein [Turneriella sp.]